MTLSILVIMLLVLCEWTLCKEYEKICRVPDYNFADLNCIFLKNLNDRPITKRPEERKPAVVHTLKNITDAAKLIGFLDMLPSLEKGNFSTKRDQYMDEIRKNVPKFLAYLEIYGKDNSITNMSYGEIMRSKTPSIGSGSLVNSQYVLTAGHCVCINETLPCQMDITGSYATSYKPFDHFIIWIGLDSELLERRYSDFDDIIDSRFRAQKIFLHPFYRMHGKEHGGLHWDTDDIALVKLDRPICLGSQISPVSLPTGWRAKIVNDGNLPSREEHVFANELDTNGSQEKYGILTDAGTMKMKEAFRSGYGIPHERDTCRTWDGRSPLQKCKFPFKVKYPIQDSDACRLYDKVFTKCVDIGMLLPPDMVQKKCLDFEALWPKNKDRKLDKLIAVGSNTLHNILRLPFEPGLSRPEFFTNFAGLYQVVDEAANCTVECTTADSLYQDKPFSIAQYGWCATCDPDAKSGEPNYCGVDAATADDQEEEYKERYIKELAVAEPGKNWGFCSDECKDLDKQFSYSVKFAGIGLISYLPEKKCQELLGEEYINIENEFCAGNLVTDQRRRFRINGVNEIIEIEPLVHWQNLTYVGGFSVGSTACGGDSGGPVFLPVVVEWEKLDLSPEDLQSLATKNVTLNNKTEHDVLNNIVRDPILIGVTRRTIGCGIKNKPAIYGKVWKYVDWIVDTIADAAAPTQKCAIRSNEKPKESFGTVFSKRGSDLLKNKTDTKIKKSDKGGKGNVFLGLDLGKEQEDLVENGLNKIVMLEKSFIFSKFNFSQEFDLDIDGTIEVEK